MPKTTHKRERKDAERIEPSPRSQRFFQDAQKDQGVTQSVKVEVNMRETESCSSGCFRGLKGMFKK